MADTRAKEPNQRDLAAAEARNRILAAAADCIVRDGLAKVRMAGIAKAAGVSAGLLHYHFDTKEQLFADVLSYSHGVSGVLNQQAMAGPGTGRHSGCRPSWTGACPATSGWPHEWLLWQELALLCIRQPELAKVGAELYEDLYADGRRHHRRGRRGPGSSPPASTPGRSPRRPWRCATASAAGCWPTTRTSPSTTPGPRSRPPSGCWWGTTARCRRPLA